MRQQCTESYNRVVSRYESNNGNLFIIDHLFDQSISHLGRASNSLLIWVYEVRVLDVVEHFQAGARLETHELHPVLVKELDLLHILRCNAHLLPSYGVKGTYLVLVEH